MRTRMCRTLSAAGYRTCIETLVAASAALFTSLALLALLALPGTASAQVTTGSIQGTVTDSTGQPLASSVVVAVDVARGFEKQATASGEGNYRISGLRPALYEVTASNAFYRDQAKRVQVGVGQSITLDFQLPSRAVEVEEIVVTAERVIAPEIETPEVATNITELQIEQLPQSDRNFLNFALLAPGVRQEGGSITSGADDAININLFIDGVSYKNDVLTGGIVGQDASAGNPFPQAAVDGFRVITQQYKAEYENATSAMITATTKTGTNRWQAEAFTYLTGENYTARPFDFDDIPDPEAEFDRYQYGGSIGGPLIQDELFVFVAYEGKQEDELVDVNLGDIPPTNLRDFEDAPGVDIPANLNTLDGTFPVPFDSNLFFGKLTWQPVDNQTLDLTLNLRDELHQRGFGNRNTISLQEQFFNTVTTSTLKHTWDVGEDMLNEALVSYLHYRFDPSPLEQGIGLNFDDWGNIGARCCPQNISQDELGIRDDMTWWVPDWGGSHVFKAGASLDIGWYVEDKPLFQNPRFTFTDLDATFPERAQLGFGDSRTETTNAQIGLYIQDDWSPTDRLTLNLGVRWDVETNARNNDWVTPDSVREAVSVLPLPPGFEETYFADEEDRAPYYGAIQPRFGATYELLNTDVGTTMLFGGAGLYYDRTPADFLLAERFRLQYSQLTFHFSEDGLPDEAGNPTIVWQDQFLSREGLLNLVEQGEAPDGEVFLVQNDLKPPRTLQGSIGVRQTVGGWLFQANYTGTRGYDDLTYWFFHREADETIDVPGFTNVLLSTQENRSWYDALFFKAQKRFTQESPWGAQVAYTLGWADVLVDGRFGGLCCLTPDEFERHPSGNDERHRLTANWIVQIPVVEALFSGIATFGSGTPFDIRDPDNPRPTGLTPTFCTPEGLPDTCIPGTQNLGRPPKEQFLFWDHVFVDRRVDLRLQKRFEFAGRYGITVQADVFDVFDSTVFNRFEGSITGADPVGTPLGVDNVTRRFQLGLRLDFRGQAPVLGG